MIFINVIAKNKISIECWLNDIGTFDSEISEYIQHINKNDEIVEDDTNDELETVLIVNLSSEGMKKIWSIIQSTGISPLNSSIRKQFHFDYLNSDRIPDKDINLTKSGLFYKNTKKQEILWTKLNDVGREAVEEANNKIKVNAELTNELTNIFKDNRNKFFDSISIGIKDIAFSYFNSGFQFITNYNDFSIPLLKHSKGKQNLFLFD